MTGASVGKIGTRSDYIDPSSSTSTTSFADDSSVGTLESQRQREVAERGGERETERERERQRERAREGESAGEKVGAIQMGDYEEGSIQRH